MDLVSVVGTIAAICTTGAYIPQILKIRKQGGEDISYPMLFLYLAGILLWLFYGLMLRAPAIIWANAVTSALVIVAIALKWTMAQRIRQARGPDFPANRT